MRRVAPWLAAVVLALAAPALRADAVALAGSDRARLQLPAAALVDDYRNAGYSVRVEEGIATVEVELAPLASGDAFELPPQAGSGSVEVLARALVAGASRRFEATSRILAWVAANLRYELDRSAAQDPESVLARRAGYCTGVARLTVALLAAVGIEAREVAGLVAGEGGEGRPSGYHRWIEVHYADRGWVFSDPLVSHHYVPATYVRLASERLLPEAQSDPARLLERTDRRLVVDLFPAAPPGITVRRNSDRQIAATLRVEVAEGDGGAVVLEGEGRRRTNTLVGGSSTFVGMSPGRYVVTVLRAGQPPAAKEIFFPDRIRGVVVFAAESSGG